MQCTIERPRVTSRPNDSQDGRSQHDDVPTSGLAGLRVVSKPKRDVLQLIGLTCWLAVWAIGEVGISVTLLVTPRITTADTVLVLWFVGWSVIGWFSGSLWLWQLVGCQELLVTPTSVMLTTRILGQERTETLDRERIRRARVIAHSAIAFEYLGKRYRFGHGLTSETCDAVIAAIGGNRPASHARAGRLAAPEASKSADTR